MKQLFTIFAIVSLSSAVTAEELDLGRIPLHLHEPGKKILAILTGPERTTVKEHFADRLDEIDFADRFDADREDYSEYYAIISGSNHVDYFGKKDVSTFQHIIDFVADGGHLFFFGSYNGRNFHIAKPLGLKTWYVHNAGFKPVPGHTEALFFGHEDSVPQNRKIRSYGNMEIGLPHVTLLRNSDEGGQPGATKLATWCHGFGRVSATMIEPYDTGPWLTPIVADWIRRGGPTVVADVQDGRAVADPITLMQSRVSTGLILSETERQSLRTTVEERLAKLEAHKRSDPEYLVDHVESHHLAKAYSFEHFLIRSVHLQLAANIAAEQVKPDVAFDAIDRAGQLTYVDGPLVKSSLLKTALKHADKSNADRIVEAALNELPKLQELYLYDIAASVADSASAAAALSEDEYLSELARKQVERVAQRQKAMADNADLLAAWRQSPTDPELLDRVGRFLTFQMNDWQLGLECLAKSENIVLSDLARNSLDLPKEATLVIRIGDRWRDIAETRDKAEKENIEKFVREMYRNLGDDLRQVSVADRRRAMDFIEAGPSVEDSIHISLTLDGYGLLTITPDGASWETKTGLEPSEISIGRLKWSKVSEPLANAGANRFIDSRVDLSTARLGDTTGRGLIRFVDRTREKVTIRINDLPRGEDRYEFEISFGK